MRPPALAPSARLHPAIPHPPSLGWRVHGAVLRSTDAYSNLSNLPNLPKPTHLPATPRPGGGPPPPHPPTPTHPPTHPPTPLSQVVLNITAQTGAGNLLGNLLCPLLGLLDSPANIFATLSSLFAALGLLLG
jgi:hypothetical protein